MRDAISDRPRGHGAGERAARIERQLEAAQQITHIGSWEWDLATNTITWSDELFRIYGLEPQSCEITLDGFLGRLHPDDRDRIQGEVRAAMERGGRFSYIERIVRADGLVRYLDSAGEVVRGPDGATVALIGTCRDVTDERRRDEMIHLYGDIVENVQIGLTVWHVPDAEAAASAQLVACNPAAERASGISRLAAEGRPLRELIAGSSGSALGALLADVARDRTVHEVVPYRFDATPEAPLFSLKGFPLPGQCVGIASEDVTAQMHARQLQAAEQRVLEMIASGVGLEEVLTALIVTIEAQAPPAIGSILLLDETGTRVRHGAAPSLPLEYSQAIDGEPIGPSAGSCGTAAYLRCPVFVVDIQTDPRWDSYRAIGLRFGLRACWSTPIIASDGRVIGTFAMYYREPRSPSREDFELIARATHVAGIAIQRKLLDDQLRALSAHIDAAREDERAGIAREIHDELGQALTALKMDMAWIARRANVEGALTRELLVGKLDAMSQMTDEIIECVRRISAELRPGVLDDLGLVAAVEWQAQEFERLTDATCVVRALVPEGRIDRQISTALFRILQEALTNVIRHAAARHVTVTLALRGDRLRLEVRDDGRGITREAISSPASLGLLGMRERARRLGGAVTIHGEPDAGTVVLADVPFPPEQGGAA